jgi:hypothetical protein
MSDNMNGFVGVIGYSKLDEEIKKAIETRNEQIIKIQGEIVAFSSVRALLSKIKDVNNSVAKSSEGVNPPSEVCSKVVEEKIIESVNPVEPEVKEVEVCEAQTQREDREKKGLCLFKHMPKDGGNWCPKKLRTTEEKESGYCSKHMKLLGIVPQKK